MSKKPKWGHLSEIDYRTNVGTPAWKKRHTTNQQKLSASRRLHELGTHEQVKNAVDSNNVKTMLNKVNELEGK